MVGLKKARQILETWNQDKHMLDADDIMEIAAKMTSAGTDHPSHRAPNRVKFADRCNRILVVFQAAKEHKLSQTELKKMAGQRPYGTVLTHLKRQGCMIERQHEIHGNRAVTYYILTRGKDG